MRRADVLKREDGFTLIEIIAVLILLGILAAVAVPKYMDLQDEARAKAADSAVAEVQARLSMAYGQYLLSNDGSEPSSVSDVCAVDATALPAISVGGDATEVPNTGSDFTVTLQESTSGTGAIVVTVVQGETDASGWATGSWTLP